MTIEYGVDRQRCVRCGRVKDGLQFDVIISSRDRLSVTCRECGPETERERQAVYHERQYERRQRQSPGYS